MFEVDGPSVYAIILYSAIAITLSSLILHTILWFKGEYKDLKEKLLDKASIKDELKAVIDNDARHMIQETMDTAFVNYAPKIQKAMIVGLDTWARPVIQESMDALGDGIGQAVGGVVQAILQHEGAQSFGKQGGETKLANAQIREGKKQLIQKMVAAKAGPMVAGVVANMGLDDEFLDLQEENPEIAAMILKNLQDKTGGDGQPEHRRESRRAPAIGGWHS